MSRVPGVTSINFPHLTTWNDADEYKRCVYCGWWYRQVVYGCAWGWEAIGKGLGKNPVGIYYFIRFSTCWDYLHLLFICSTCYIPVSHMYSACIWHHSNALSDTSKRHCSNMSLFAPSLQCCFSLLSTTWLRPPLLMQALPLPLRSTHWMQIIAWTLLIVEYCIVTIFSCTLMFHAQRSGTQSYHLPSIAFLCLFVHCLCQSTFWHGL